MKMYRDQEEGSEQALAALREEATAIAHRRERLLAALALIAGIGLIIALPFALRAGAEFFLPVTAALVVAVALVPLLEWLERRRLPSGVAAFLCVGVFLGLVNVAIASIVVPASGWVALLPSRIGQVKSTIRPIMEIYRSLDRFISETTRQVTIGHVPGTRTVTLAAPNSLLDLVATSAPHAIVQMFFGVLVIYFFLAGWTSMRRRAIASRGRVSSAMATTHVIQDVVEATSSYLTTITLINLMMGVAVAVAMWVIGMPTPLMWGGIVGLLNYVPYLGPIAAALLLALGGLMTFADLWSALLPAACFVGIHLVEANAITPTIIGRKLTINPLLILVALSFWGWVWGTLGALLAVPLLIILKTVLDAAGKPDIAGFLFEDGTLAHIPHEEEGRAGEELIPGGMGKGG